MRKLVVVFCLFAMSPSRAEAWNPIKAAADKLKAAGRAVGGVLGIPAGGFIESATTPVIHNVEDAGHHLIADVDSAIAANLERTGGLVKGVKDGIDDTVAHVDRSLAARILQVQTGVDHTIDHAFDRLDVLFGRLDDEAKRLLEHAERAGKNLIKQLDGTAAANIARVDKVLTARVHDIQLLVSSSLQDADDIARQRLEQLDELAGRRVGNLDVIATKQSLSLEGMLVRIAALVGLVGLIAFVAWRLFRELTDALALANARGTKRLRTIGWCSITRLVPQLALAAAGALVLYFLSNYLPRASEVRAGKQIENHETAFEAAARSLDVIDARYHESQLEILAPDKIAAYRGRMKKTELLHSLFTRPGQLHTQEGLANLVAEVGEVEAALPAEDPDVTIAKAYVLWQVGGTRDDEYEAAMLCATALKHDGSALLAPLARNYIAMFLADPYTPHAPASTSLDELAKLAEMPPGTHETPQFDRVIELDKLLRDLDRKSTAAYLDMLAAHADLRTALAAQPKGPDSPAACAARDARTAAAQKLIDVWAAFDHALEGSLSFASDAMVLSVFTLDDAVLTRARYWAAVPSANDLAPMLTAQPVPRSLTPALRARIAPLRVAWGARYAPILGPNERDIVAYQETQRFQAFEQRAYAFETAYVDFLIAAKTGAAPAKLLEVATSAATRASGMGLYRDSPAGRITEASNILAITQSHGKQASSAVLADIELNYRARRLRFL
jgi:hypothetical protein